MSYGKCSKLLTLASAAILAGGIAIAQAPMGSGSQPHSGSVNNNSMPNATQANMQAMNMASSSQSGASMQDKKFAKDALEGGMAEIQLGQLALQKSNSDDVKQFATTMINDHSKLNDQMKPIAQQIGVPVPSGPSAKDEALMTKLQGLQGDAFDRAYIKAMVKDHRKDNKDFEMEATSGQNSDEKMAAQQGDQIIKHHLELAENLAKAHNVPVKGM